MQTTKAKGETMANFDDYEPDLSKPWTTYAVTDYTHDIACHPDSAGGIHEHQIRRTQIHNDCRSLDRCMQWEKRIVQINGKHRALGPVIAVSDTEGQSLLHEARKLETSK